MPDRPKLSATTRTVTGKKVALIRRAGGLPAVIYGHGTASEPVTLDAHDFGLLRRHVGASTLVDVSVDGGKARPVLLQDVQIHPVGRQIIHVDLFAVRMTEELSVDIRLIGEGVLPVSVAGGSLVHPVSSVHARALPGDLPDAIHYDLSSLDSFEAVITVGDLVVPKGVTIQTDPADIIARVLAPRGEEVVEGAVEPVVEAPAADAPVPARGAPAAS
jgi:large subunit ribosomal protein L25